MAKHDNLLSRAILVGLWFGFVELRWLSRRAYGVRGWGSRRGVFVGLYQNKPFPIRFLVVGPLMISIERTVFPVNLYVRVF